MDVPDEINDVLRLAREGFTGSRILCEAITDALKTHPRTWQEHFAERYIQGLQAVLSGNTLADFASALNVVLPAKGVLLRFPMRAGGRHARAGIL